MVGSMSFWGVQPASLDPNTQKARNKMNAEQILQELDEAFAAWPVDLHTEPHHSKPADARLTVFRSPQHWVVIIKKIDYFIRLHGSVDCFSRSYTLYGNCLGDGWLTKHDLLWDSLLELPFDPETGTWLPTRQHFRYFWAGKWWEASPTPQELQQAGIDPELLDEVDCEEWRENPNALLPVEWLRYLCHHLNHPFFASEARLREVVREAVSAPQIESELQIVLQTRDWEHPDFVKGELPSDTESFRVIAEILATGDASLWARVDRSRFNSFWRYWVEKDRAEEEVFHQRPSLDEKLWASLMAQFLQATVAGSDIVVLTSVRFNSDEARSQIMEMPAQVVLAENGADPFFQWLVGRYGPPAAGESLRDWFSRCVRVGDQEQSL
jgi:hypothetical protein